MQATIAKSADYDEIAWQLQALCSIATMWVIIERIFSRMPSRCCARLKALTARIIP
jgi:hypothetical protein